MTGEGSRPRIPCDRAQIGVDLWIPIGLLVVFVIIILTFGEVMAYV